MYNRYIPGPDGYARVPEPDEAPRAAAHHAQETPTKEEKKSGGLSALLRHLKLEDLDKGDILLLLIVLFLFLEGDDLELVITLGLLLVLGLE